MGDVADTLSCCERPGTTLYTGEQSLFKRSESLFRDWSAASREATDKDAAEMLYRHGIGSVIVSAFASSGLAFIARAQLPKLLLRGWWLCIVLILLMRVLDIIHFHRVRARLLYPGVYELRRFATGLFATAALWAAFPIMFLQRLNQSGRACTAIVLCGMAGGSATVLAPSKTFSPVFCAFLLLPASLLFLTLPGADNTFFGIMGCVFFVVIFISARVAHHATMTAVQLTRANQALLKGVEEAQRRTEAANVELKGAQSALSEANQSLEVRIRQRTADLEKEMREKERYARQLAHLASTDSLTGLCNRASLGKRLGEALALAEAKRQSVAVLFLDLDKFKEVNDVLGHLAGDSVLQVAAARLLQRLPPEVDLARWGGDEFVVALPGLASTKVALDLAIDLRKCLCDPIRIDLGVVTIDATIGIALFPEHGRTEEDLIRAADMAMYTSKQEKRSKIRLFDPSLSQRVTERHLLESALRKTIHSGGLDVVFQPIISMLSGECESVEALARWNHPKRGQVPPSEFIPLAEWSGDIAALGRWVLSEACRQAASWRGASAPAVSVNVSVVQLESGTLERDVADILKRTGLPPARLQLELTESVFSGDRSAIVPALSRLRQMGVKISLDDFGTGFSCLADLRRLPIDRLKIDKSFIEAIEVDAGAIVRAIVVTAQTLGLEIVAEGVETTKQAETLTNLGVQYLQGYLFSDALSAHAAREWLRPKISLLSPKTVASSTAG